MGSRHTQAQTQALGSRVTSQTDQGSWAHAWPRGRVMDTVTIRAATKLWEYRPEQNDGGTVRTPGPGDEQEGSWQVLATDPGTTPSGC